LQTRLLDKAVAERNAIESQLDSLKQGIRENKYELEVSISYGKILYLL